MEKPGYEPSNEGSLDAEKDKKMDCVPEPLERKSVLATCST